jgi:hypothetical protein
MRSKVYTASVSVIVILIIATPFIVKADVISSGTYIIAGTRSFDFAVGVGSDIDPNLGADVWWQQVSDTTRSLNPVNDVYLWSEIFFSGRPDATIVNIGGIGTDGFTAYTLTQLQALSYGTAGIDGSDASNVLVLGDVFAVNTGAGNFAKVLVTGPFDSDYNHGLPIQWVTYSAAEPTSMLFLVFGLMGLAGLRRKFKN